jgi:hypothetical protein
MKRFRNDGEFANKAFRFGERDMTANRRIELFAIVVWVQEHGGFIEAVDASRVLMTI